MIGAGFALLLAQSNFSPLVLLSGEEARERAAYCDIEQVETHYEQLYQIDSIIVGDPEISDEQLHCLSQAFADTKYDLEVPEQYRPRLAQITESIWSPRLEATARRWFADRQLASAVEAIPFADLSLAETVQAIECLCGEFSAGALASQSQSLVISPDWIARTDPSDESHQEAAGCLLNALIVGRVSFGFIGNERLPDAE